MSKPSLTQQVFSSPIHFLAFGFGSGLSPIAPGTVGTLAAIPLYLLMSLLSPVGYVVLLLVIIVAGVWICDQSAHALGLEDPGGIVWDEFAGFLVTMFLAPQGWAWLLAGFVLFRLFDIWKPYPISWLDQQVKGGMGIMLDDLVAGLYAWLVLQGVSLLLTRL